MKRGLTGRYEVTSTAGEQVRAFVPSALPPQPPLDLTNGHQRLLDLGRAASTALRVFHLLCERPLLTLNEVHLRVNLSFATAAKAMDRLIAAGIVSELTGRQRNRVFAYDRYLAILNKGMEPL